MLFVFYREQFIFL